MAGVKGMHKVRQFDEDTVERMRERIRTSGIGQRLVLHVNGKVKMSNTQVTAALGLLRKVLPDLQSTEFSIKTGSYADDLLTIQGGVERALPAPSAQQITHNDELPNQINDA